MHQGTYGLFLLLIKERFGIEMNIEQKYGHIDLGELRKKIKDIPNINIPQSLVNTANELSHDSGKKYNIENNEYRYN